MISWVCTEERPSAAKEGWTRERQEPLVTLGYHREWAPGSHTLFLAGRFDDTYDVTDPQASNYLFRFYRAILP